MRVSPRWRCLSSGSSLWRPIRLSTSPSSRPTRLRRGKVSLSTSTWPATMLVAPGRSLRRSTTKNRRKALEPGPEAVLTMRSGL
eukprot:715921-Lingulodinium_polyedra.AAC.1